MDNQNNYRYDRPDPNKIVDILRLYCRACKSIDIAWNTSMDGVLDAAFMDCLKGKVLPILLHNLVYTIRRFHILPVFRISTFS